MQPAHTAPLRFLSLWLASSVTHGHISNFTLQVTAQKIQFVFVSPPFSAISIKWEWLTSKINGCFQTPKTNGVDSKNRKLIVQECPWKVCVSPSFYPPSLLNPLSTLHSWLLLDERSNAGFVMTWIWNFSGHAYLSPHWNLQYNNIQRSVKKNWTSKASLKLFFWLLYLI